MEQRAVRTVLIVAGLFLLCLGWAGYPVRAPGTITIGFEAKPPEININESNRLLIMHGYVGYNGVSVRPFTIYLEPICDVGDAYLSRYEFVFHVPDSIPFDAFIFIFPDTENDTQGTITLKVSYSEGIIKQEAGSVSQIITVLNYNENEVPNETIEETNIDDQLWLKGLIGLTCVSVITIFFAKRKMKGRK